MTKLENWIGSGLSLKVIIQGNDERYKIGTLIGFERPNEKSSEVPIVEVEGKNYISFGVVIPYSEEVAAMLKPLDYHRQWEILSALYTAAQVARR